MGFSCLCLLLDELCELGEVASLYVFMCFGHWFILFPAVARASSVIVDAFATDSKTTAYLNITKYKYNTSRRNRYNHINFATAELMRTVS